MGKSYLCSATIRWAASLVHVPTHSIPVVQISVWVSLWSQGLKSSIRTYTRTPGNAHTHTHRLTTPLPNTRERTHKNHALRSFHYVTQASKCVCVRKKKKRERDCVQERIWLQLAWKSQRGRTWWDHIYPPPELPARSLKTSYFFLLLLHGNQIKQAVKGKQELSPKIWKGSGHTGAV